MTAKCSGHKEYKIVIIPEYIGIDMALGLVSLFNGISTFVCYLMPKPFSQKNSSGTI